MLTLPCPESIKNIESVIISIPPNSRANASSFLVSHFPSTPLYSYLSVRFLPHIKPVLIKIPSPAGFLSIMTLTLKGR
jgi:hypothetical protein